MISDALDGGKSTRYRHAARHLAECRSSDAIIEDYGTIADHCGFLTHLKQKHPRNFGFWELVDG
jgi:hypothetical protein